jgi:acyl-CoA synthetase (AMP-forming)/AMP-acid ligase II
MAIVPIPGGRRRNEKNDGHRFMILTSSDRAAGYRGAGLWSDFTLDDLFSQTVQRHPDRLAVVDAPDHPAPQRLTYKDLDKRVTALGDFFLSLNLPADSIAACQMDNSVEAVIFYLGCWRAGLIVAPMPTYWQLHEITNALTTLSPRILCAHHATEGEKATERLRDAAAELFSVRFAFGFGDGLPDGLFDLTELYDDADIPNSNLVLRNADEIATITFSLADIPGTGTIPVPRSHNHWFATGKHILDRCDLADVPTVISPFCLSGIAGMGSAVMPWLISGGVLHLHKFSTTQHLVRHVSAVGADLFSVPGPLVPTAVRPFANSKDQSGPTVLAIWKDQMPHGVQSSPVNLAVKDLAVFNELSFMLIDRLDGHGPGGLPIGKGTQEDLNFCDVNVSIKATPQPNKAVSKTSSLLSGTLQLRGAMVPDSALVMDDTTENIFDNWVNSDGTVKTNIKLTLVQTKPALGQMGGRTADVYLLNGVAVDAAELDQLYTSFPAVIEAASVHIADEIGEDRLYAAIVANSTEQFSVEQLCNFLREKQVSALKFPSNIIFVDQIPRTEHGKIRREDLAQNIQAA